MSRENERLGDGLTREHVRWAYRLFLDREPESEDVLDLPAMDTSALRHVFLSSSEYQLTNSGVSTVGDKWVIVPTDLGFRIFVNLKELGICRPILMGAYETAAVQLFKSLVNPGDRVFDIGANIGFHTMWLSKLVGAAGEVLAFEPVRYLYDALVKSISENQFDDRCQAINCAVSDASGTGLIRHAPETTNFGGAHLTRDRADDNHAYETIQLRTLSEFISDKRCSFIKIDTEGSEAKVLRGGGDLLRRDRPVVFAELFNEQLKKVSGATASQLIRDMAELGYRCFETDAGHPGSEIRSYDEPALINVVFLC
jgi:FkbM family methyltransferase